MDKAKLIRVKLESRKNIKVARLDTRSDTTLRSMANLRNLIYKNFPEVRETVAAPGTSTAAPMLLSVKCQDNSGDFVTLETDEDLEVARENFPKRKDLRFKVDFISRTSTVPAPAGLTAGRARFEGSSNRVSGRSYAAVAENNVAKLCHAFQKGHCRNGPTCPFSHDRQGKPSPASSSSGRGNRRGNGFVTGIQDKGTNESNFSGIREIDSWLRNQLDLLSGDNIEQLSGE